LREAARFVALGAVAAGVSKSSYCKR
jgi:hypothetical protein